MKFREHLIQPPFLIQKETEAQSGISKAKAFLAGQ